MAVSRGGAITCTETNAILRATLTRTRRRRRRGASLIRSPSRSLCLHVRSLSRSFARSLVCSSARDAETINSISDRNDPGIGRPRYSTTSRHLLLMPLPPSSSYPSSLSLSFLRSLSTTRLPLISETRGELLIINIDLEPSADFFRFGI